MRIILLHDSYSPADRSAVSGEDNIVRLEIELLRRRGHEVIDFRNYPNGKKSKTRHLVVHTTGHSNFKLEQFERIKPDVIHAYNLSLRTGYSWLKNPPAPVVLSLHNFRTICPIAIAWRKGEICFQCRDKGPQRAIFNGCESWYGTLGAIRRLIFDQTNIALKNSVRVIATSKKMRDSLIDVIPLEKVHVLGSTSRFSPRKNSGDTSKGFLYLGRFSEEKGIGDLIINWPKEEKLTMFGEGKIPRALRLIAAQKGIKIFPPVFSSLEDALNGYEALVFPSTWLEGSPLVIYEALALGLPVLTGPQSSASEIVTESKSGVVIDSFKKCDEIRAGIKRLRVQFDSLVSNAFQASTHTFSQEEWIMELEKILSKATTQS